MFSTKFEFAEVISSHTRDFAGREWIFERIDKWLGDPTGSRYFLISGEPGVGKTAIACRLYQFSQGSFTISASYENIKPGFISAFHHCSANDKRWIHPASFVESIANQLSSRFSSFEAALLRRIAPSIQISQSVSANQGSVIGAQIRTLVSSLNVDDLFNSLVREPLEFMVSSVFEEQVIILVDGLDEAITYSGKLNIITLLSKLEYLSNKVRFILCSRPDSRVENEFISADRLLINDPSFQNSVKQDIQKYLEIKLNSLELIDLIEKKAEGNFLYINFLINSLSQQHDSYEDLNALPDGLENLYYEYLRRIVDTGGKDWREAYAPILGFLSLAQENITLRQLQSFTGFQISYLLECVDDLEQFIEKTISVEFVDRKSPGYHIHFYHQSVSEFLNKLWLTRNNVQVRNKFYLPAEEWHKRLASWCIEQPADGKGSIWMDTEDPIEQARKSYARQYIVTHLYYAGDNEKLGELLNNKDFIERKIEYDPSLRGLNYDLELGERMIMSKDKRGEEQLDLFPDFWRYHLLRSTINSRVAELPLEVFESMLFLGKDEDVLRMTDLVISNSAKAEVLGILAEYYGKNQESEKCKKVLLRALKVAEQITDRRRENLVFGTNVVFRGSAETVIGSTVKINPPKENAQVEMSIDWENDKGTPELLIIRREDARIECLTSLLLIREDTLEIDHEFMEAAERIIETVSNPFFKSMGLIKVAVTYFGIGNFQKSDETTVEVLRITEKVDSYTQRVVIISNLVPVLLSLEQEAKAKHLLEQISEDELQNLTDEIEQKHDRNWAINSLVNAFITLKDWPHAIRLTNMMEYKANKAMALFAIAANLIDEELQDWANSLLIEARQIAADLSFFGQAKVYEEIRPYLRETVENVLSSLFLDNQLKLVKEGERETNTSTGSYISLIINKVAHKREIEVLSHLLAISGRWEDGYELAGSIEDRVSRIQVLFVLASQLFKSGHPDKAKQIYEEIIRLGRLIGPSKYLADEAETLLKARLMAKERNFAQVKTLLSNLANSKPDDALRHIVEDLSKEGALELAESIVNWSGSDLGRADLWLTIVKMRSFDNKGVEINRQLEFALNAVQDITIPENRISGLISISELYIRNGAIDSARHLLSQAIEFIELSNDRSALLQQHFVSIVSIIISGQLWEELSQLKKAISETDLSLNLQLRLMTATLANSKLDSNGEEIKDQLMNLLSDLTPKQLNDNLFEVVAAYIALRQGELIHNIYHKIESDYDRGRALIWYAQSLNEKENIVKLYTALNEAMLISNAVDVSWQQANLKFEIAQRLTELKDFKNAIKVMSTIHEIDQLSLSLNQLIEAMVNAGLTQDALKLMQELIYQIDMRGPSVKLLGAIIPLVQSHHGFGQKLYEVFTWADGF